MTHDLLRSVAMAVIAGGAMLTAAPVSGQSTGQEHPPSSEAAAFDVFVRAAAATCLSRPSAECVDSGWNFADRDQNERLTAAEFTRMRQDLGEWFSWRAPSLTARERNALTLGLLVIDSMGMEQIVGGFDADMDGSVTRMELLADITLDERPLGKILVDPEAVDRAEVARRFGAASALLPQLAR